MAPTDNMCLVKGTWAVGNMGASSGDDSEDVQVGLAMPTTKKDPLPYEFDVCSIM